MGPNYTSPPHVSPSSSNLCSTAAQSKNTLPRMQHMQQPHSCDEWCWMQGWGDAKITAVREEKSQRVTTKWPSAEPWGGAFIAGGSRGWTLLRGKCVCSMVKSAVATWKGLQQRCLAEKETPSNTTGYYYRRRLNRSLKNTQTVFSQQREWHDRI